MTRSFIRAGHGKGEGRPHVETPPRDELPAGVAVVEAAPTGPQDRAPNGRFVAGEAARRAGQRGGKKKAANTALATTWAGQIRRTLRIGGNGENASVFLQVSSHLTRFVDEAERAYTAKCEELARDIGGGYCGVGVSACLRQWAHAHYYALALMELAEGPIGSPRNDRKGQLTLKLQSTLLSSATRLMAEARQCLLVAHSLAAEEAKARAARGRPGDDRLPGEVDE